MLLRIWKYIQGKFFNKIEANKYVPLARRILKPGQVCWECDLLSGNVTKAEVIEMPWTNSNGTQRVIREVVIKRNCIYELAINGDNAVRKFEKRIVELSKNKKL